MKDRYYLHGFFSKIIDKSPFGNFLENNSLLNKLWITTNINKKEEEMPEDSQPNQVKKNNLNESPISHIILESIVSKEKIRGGQLNLAPIVEKQETITKKVVKEQKKVVEDDEYQQKEEQKSEIFDPSSFYSVLFWIYFLSSTSTIIYLKYFFKWDSQKYITKLSQIKSKFYEWIINIFCWIFLLFNITYLIKAIILNYFGEDVVNDLLKKNEILTILSFASVLGLLFIWDSKISSELKTPLQRLSMQIENSPIDEKNKKFLLSKAQEINELIKETLKKFGILVVPAILSQLLGNYSKSIYYQTSFLWPLGYASVGILQTIRTLRQLEVELEKENF